MTSSIRTYLLLLLVLSVPRIVAAASARSDAGTIFPFFDRAGRIELGADRQAPRDASVVVDAGAASEQAPATNINTRYEVEGVTLSGFDESTIGQGLRNDIRALIGKKYDPNTAQEVAERIGTDLGGYRVRVKVRRGDKPEHVKVVFEAERFGRRRFDVRVSPLLYTNDDSFSLALVPGFETHHNHFSVGIFTNANDVPIREAGLVLRYEHRKVGTSAVQVGVEYDHFWSRAPRLPPSGASPVLRSLILTDDDSREVFAPTISLLPTPDVKLTVGATFQTLHMPVSLVGGPFSDATFDRTAHAFSLGVQYRKEDRPQRPVRQGVRAEYAMRHATRTLESDFLYTRHWAAGDYTVALGRQEFGFSFAGGRLSGSPPLHERFSIGGATTLRGWDRSEVAVYGGTRLLHGSLAYRYRPFELFYDFGTVWDPDLNGNCLPLNCGARAADWKHSVGIGFAWRNGFFLSVGVPVRSRGVKPAFMFGFRR